MCEANISPVTVDCESGGCVCSQGLSPVIIDCSTANFVAFFFRFIKGCYTAIMLIH